jgi:DNA primase catalytic core
MARIPDGVIERLKTEVSVQRLVEARGVVLTKHGADLHGRCPFHDDRTPSLVITPAKNLWHCMGACQAGGTVIDWVMKAEGISFRHAVELLQNDGLPLAAASSGSVPPKQSTVRKLPTALQSDQDDAKLLVQVIDFYHQTLLQSPEALAYLQRRGIDSPEAVTTFKLGFANRTLGYRLPEKTRVQGAVLRGQLQRIGVLRASGHEHFSGSIVIPMIAASGEVTEVYGRKITPNLREGTPLHLYLPGPHRGVWNAAALGATKEVILCEALIDALTFWCAGFRNVTASYGVEGFTADHLACFKQCGIERVLIAYDRDEAGDRAAEKLAQQLMAEGLDCYRILFPKGLDANEYALKVGPAAKSLGVAIRSAQWLGNGAAPGTGVAPGTGQAKPITTAEPTPSVEVHRVESVTVPPSLPSPKIAPAVAHEPPLAAERQSLPTAPTQTAPEASPPAALPTSDLPLPAAVIPAAAPPPPQVAAKALGAAHASEHVIRFGDRRYRVRGLDKNLAYEVLKVNVLVSRTEPHAGRSPGADDPHNADGGESVHVDTFDLYQARHRAAFARSAAAELGLAEEVIKADLGKLLLALEMEQEKLIEAAQAPKSSAVVPIDDADREAALALLRRPDLIERIAADFGRCGIVGERTNALMGYLSAISRKLDRPLALLIQSTSAAGKSSLMDAVLQWVPPEDRVVYSAMTGQSLFYMGEMDLKHKILAIAEEEGVHRASYALKLLQSEGELTIASTSKDPETGKLVTDAYHVEGPVMIFSTTTAADLDEELQNRCLVLTVDESREQTAAIHAAQRAKRTLAGLQAKAERAQLLKLHQNAQRLIEPLAVMNPYAHHLTFINDRTRTRRDHEKYLTLIDVIALLHQHQRVLRTAEHEGQTLKYVEVTLEDIALANQLAHEVLGRTLDELPPQTRRLLSLVVERVEQQCAAQQINRTDYRFSRREVREHTRWGDTQLRLHLARLTELEYLLVHRGGRGQSFEYELLYDGKDELQRHLSGLIDVEVLRCDYDGVRAGQTAQFAGVDRPLIGPRSGGDRGAESLESADKYSTSEESAAQHEKPHGTRANGHDASYVPESAAVAVTSLT